MFCPAQSLISCRLVGGLVTALLHEHDNHGTAQQAACLYAAYQLCMQEGAE